MMVKEDAAEWAYGCPEFGTQCQGPDITTSWGNVGRAAVLVGGVAVAVAAPEVIALGASYLEVGGLPSLLAASLSSNSEVRAAAIEELIDRIRMANGCAIFHLQVPGASASAIFGKTAIR